MSSSNGDLYLYFISYFRKENTVLNEMNRYLLDNNSYHVNNIKSLPQDWRP